MTSEGKRKWLEGQLKNISDGTGEWVNPPWSNEIKCRICGHTWYPLDKSDRDGFCFREIYMCPKGCKPEESELKEDNSVIHSGL